MANAPLMWVAITEDLERHLVVGGGHDFTVPKDLYEDWLAARNALFVAEDVLWAAVPERFKNAA